MCLVRPIILLIGCMFMLTGCGYISAMQARSAIEAINNGDVETYLKDWDENATFIYPGNASASGVVTGKKAIREWFENWKKVFPEFQFTIQNIYFQNKFYIGDDNVIAVHWEAQATNKFGKKIYSTGVGVVTIKGAKVIRVHDYIFDADRLKEFWGE